jgi:hypothetical protein
MRKIVALLPVSIVLLALLSGCLEQPKAPKELYKELVQKGGTLPNGKFNYSINFGVEERVPTETGSAYGFKNIRLNADIYSFNGNRKTVVATSTIANSATVTLFELNGELTTCTDYPAGGSSPVSGTIFCQKGDPNAVGIFTGKQFTQLFEEVRETDLTLAAVLQQLPKSEQESNPLPDLNGAKAEYEVCLDKQYGFASFSNLVFLRSSEAGAEEEKLLAIDTTLNSYAPAAASEADLQIPSEVVA